MEDGVPKHAYSLGVVLLLGASHLAQAATCESLAALGLQDSAITLANRVTSPIALETGPGFPPVTVAVPICRVAATLTPTSDSQIKVEVWLPAPESWNGKFEGIGNGGLGGAINYAGMVPGLQLGYAVAATDTGHDNAGGSGAFALHHPEKVADYGYRAAHVTAVFGKALTEAYYGHAPAHAYFVGCSKGGAEALMEAQRFPEDYEGIVAGDPAAQQTHHEVGAHLWIPLALSADAGSALSLAKAALVGKAVNEACDALDGVKDGVLEDPRQCHFDPGRLLCKGPDAADCLTDLQVAAVRKLWDGPQKVLGANYYPGLERGGEAETWKWWIIPVATRGSQSGHSVLGLPFFRYFVYDDPNWDFRAFNFKTDPLLIDRKWAAALNATNPDLKHFKARGGKLIHYHGYSDPDIPPRSSIDYYERVTRTLGGRSQVDSFYRLFMVPGMGHCTGGPGANAFNVLPALEEWVEHGLAPAKIIATKYYDDDAKKRVVRTHPLCPYPLTAHYDGKGSTDEAASYRCATALR
jgi:feruloyl esterase